MEPNYFVFSLSEMNSYVELCQAGGDATEWEQILKLKQRPRVTFIQVVDNKDRELAFAGWGWNGDEINFGKIHVHESLRGKRIADTIMKMFVAIAKSSNASKISGVIDGDDFLWDWYKKLGFTIYDDNKILMELRNS